MFNDIKSALVYIESKRTKRTLEQFKETIKKYGFNIYQKNIIHIAGTNGKGSTTNFIKDIMVEHGYRVEHLHHHILFVIMIVFVLMGK